MAEPKDRKLFDLSAALVKDGLAFIERLLSEKRSIKTYDKWPTITWSDGMPDFTFYGDQPPTDYRDAFHSLRSLAALFGPSTEAESLFNFDKQQTFQEMKRHIQGDPPVAAHVFPHDLPEWLFSSALNVFLEDVTDHYVHVSGQTAYDPDKFLEAYLPLEAGLLSEELPVEIHIPVLLVKMASDAYEITDGISIERMSEPLQLARARRDHGTHSVSEYLLEQASHALVLRDHILPTSEYRQRFWGYSVSDPTLDTIDMFFACFKIVTSIDTGYAQILFVPVGWAFTFAAHLPALEGLTSRKYPPTLKHVNTRDGDEFPLVSDLQIEEVRDLFRALNALRNTNEGGRLRLVIKRLNSCYMREDQEDAILDATIGLEILLSDGETQEVTHKLALRLAALSTLVAGFADQAPTVFRNVKKTIYPYRSAVVHGNEKKASQTRAMRTDTGEVGAVNLAMAYLGMALRAVAAHPEFLDPAVIDNDLLLGQKYDRVHARTPAQGETS